MGSGGEGSFGQFYVFFTVVFNVADFRRFVIFQTAHVMLVAHLTQRNSRGDTRKRGVSRRLIPQRVPLFVPGRRGNVTVMAWSSIDTPGVNSGITITLVIFALLSFFQVTFHLLDIFTLPLDINHG